MSTVQDAIKAEKAYYVDNNVYTADVADNGQLDQIEPSIKYFSAGNAGTCPVGGFTSGPKCVRIELSDSGGFTNNVVTTVAQSESGTFWAMKDIASGNLAGTFYDENTQAAGAQAPGDVTGAEW